MPYSTHLGYCGVVCFDSHPRGFGAADRLRHGLQEVGEYVAVHIAPRHDCRVPEHVSVFRGVVVREKYQFTTAGFYHNMAWMKANLRKELYVAAFGAEEARRIGVESDPMVERAVEAMPKATALLKSANRVIVQRIAK